MKNPIGKLEDLMGSKLDKLFAYYTLYKQEEREEFLQMVYSNRGKYNNLLDDFKAQYGYQPPREFIELEECLPAFERYSVDKLGITRRLVGLEKHITINMLENSQNNYDGDLIYMLVCGVQSFVGRSCYGNLYYSTLPNPLNVVEVFSRDYNNLSHYSYSISEFVIKEFCILNAGLSNYSLSDHILNSSVCDSFENDYENKIKTREYYYDPMLLHKRSYWLIELINNKTDFIFIYNISDAPDFTVWRKEKELVAKIPVVANYWLLAHLFLGNLNACKECIEIAMNTPGKITPKLAELIDSALNTKDDTDSKLFNISSDKLHSITRQIRKSAPLELFEPEVRKDIEEKQS